MKHDIYSLDTIKSLKFKLQQIKEATKSLEKIISNEENNIDSIYTESAKLWYASKSIYDVADKINNDAYYYMVNPNSK